MNNSNQMVVRTGENMLIKDDGSIKFANVADVLDYSGLVVSAGMAPKGKTKEQVAVSIIAGAQLGLNPFASMQNVAVINGMPSVWGDALVGLVMASGQLEDIKTEYLPNQKDCVGVQVTISRKGVKSPFVGTFSVTQAKAAGLWGKPGPWTQYPQRMMFNRARAFALRDAFPDVIKGLRIAEEEMDRTEPIEAGGVTVTPPPYADDGAGKRKRGITADSLIKAAAKGEEAKEVAVEPPLDDFPTVEPDTDVEIRAEEGGE